MFSTPNLTTFATVSAFVGFALVVVFWFEPLNAFLIVSTTPVFCCWLVWLELPKAFLIVSTTPVFCCWLVWLELPKAFLIVSTTPVFCCCWLVWLEPPKAFLIVSTTPVFCCWACCWLLFEPNRLPIIPPWFWVALAAVFVYWTAVFVVGLAACWLPLDSHSPILCIKYLIFINVYLFFVFI